MSVSIMHQMGFRPADIEQYASNYPFIYSAEDWPQLRRFILPVRSTLTLGDGAINFFVLMDLRTHTLY